LFSHRMDPQHPLGARMPLRTVWTAEYRLGLESLLEVLEQHGWEEEALHWLEDECLRREGTDQPWLALAWQVEEARELLLWLGYAPER
jgi:hypothetical protein